MTISKSRGQLFLDFEDEKEHVIKPTYAKGCSRLPSIGFTNALCAHFTCMTTGHASIREYRQHFFPNSSLSSQAELQTHEHIIMQCGSHNPSTRPCIIIINSFVHFLVDNPMAFSFDNGWPLYVVHPQGKSTALLFPSSPSPILPFTSFVSYLLLLISL